MTGIRKSPFRHGQDPLDHMLLALSVEAQAAGTPLSDTERKMLAAEAAPERPLPDDLKERVKPLISTILQRERTADPGTISIGFGDVLEWLEPDYPNIAAPVEEVITSGGSGGLRQLHGARLIKNRAQLVGWAIAPVVASMAIAVAVGFLLGRR